MTIISKTQMKVNKTNNSNRLDVGKTEKPPRN